MIRCPKQRFRGKNASAADLVTATGARAVPGSPQPRRRDSAPVYSTMPVRPDALRAGDGSRSALRAPSGPLAAVSGCARASESGFLPGGCVSIAAFTLIELLV